MKYNVKVEDRVFKVEILDIHARPVIAIVDGIQVEVWPDHGIAGKVVQPEVKPAASPRVPAAPAAAPRTLPASPDSADMTPVVRAPIPGVIVSISIQPGAEVAQGQELCVLEAMKMKNIIRSSRPGTIAAVKVQIGQHVKHHDVLMEYAV